MKDGFLWEEVVHSAGEAHVHEGVDPQRREQIQQLASSGVANVLLVVGAHGVQDEANCLPGGAHDEDPAVALLEDEGFDDVGCEEDAEEDGDGYSRGE